MKSTPPQWAARAEEIRQQLFAQGIRAHPWRFAREAAEELGLYTRNNEEDLDDESDRISSNIEVGLDMGCLDIQLGYGASYWDDPWMNMAASMARTWARLWQ